MCFQYEHSPFFISDMPFLHFEYNIPEHVGWLLNTNQVHYKQGIKGERTTLGKLKCSCGCFGSGLMVVWRGFSLPRSLLSGFRLLWGDHWHFLWDELDQDSPHLTSCRISVRFIRERHVKVIFDHLVIIMDAKPSVETLTLHSFDLVHGMSGSRDVHTSEILSSLQIQILIPISKGITSCKCEGGPHSYTVLMNSMKNLMRYLRWKTRYEV